MRTLGKNGPQVGALGLGCMGMSDLYGPADETEGIATIHAALDAGSDPARHRRLLRHGPQRAAHPRGARRAATATTCGSASSSARSATPTAAGSATTCRPAAVKNCLAYTLRRLGTDHVDIYRPARLDPTCPSRRPSARSPSMVEAGYVRHIGLSEVGADDHPPRARRAPHRRPADRVLAAVPRDRGRDPAHLPRAGHRHHRVRRAVARAAERPLVEGPRAAAGRLPRPRAPLQRRQPGRATSPWSRRCARSPRPRARRSPSSPSPGCSRRATTSCRWSAPAAGTGSPRRWARST